jgi:hypothetical protein
MIAMFDSDDYPAIRGSTSGNTRWFRKFHPREVSPDDRRPRSDRHRF